MKQSKVKAFMTAHPTFIQPDATLQDAAQKMQKVDCGILPVGTVNKLEGIITDRDIVVRAIADGVDPMQTTAAEYMSDKVYSCNEGNTLKEAADLMRKYQVSRLVVHNEAGQVVGILSFGGILRKDANAKEVAEVVEHATRSEAA